MQEAEAREAETDAQSGRRGSTRAAFKVLFTRGGPKTMRTILLFARRTTFFQRSTLCIPITPSTFILLYIGRPTLSLPNDHSPSQILDLNRDVNAPGMSAANDNDNDNAGAVGDIIEEVGYRITGPGYTIYEYDLTVGMETSTSTSPTANANANKYVAQTQAPSYSISTSASYSQDGTYDTAYYPTTTASASSSSSTGQYYYGYDTAADSYAYPSPSPASASASASTSDVAIVGAPVYHLNGTSTQEGNATESAGTEANNNSSGGISPKAKNALQGVLGTVGALVVILGLVWWIQRRRAKKRVRRGEDPEMEQVRHAALPGGAGGVMAYDDSATRPRLTDQDSLDVVALPPPLARYSRIMGDQPPPPALPPRTARSTNPNRLSSLVPSRSPRFAAHRNSTAASSWADDSEYDAFATDGSSIARTLSTHSMSSRLSDITATASENPFDHPAYTLNPGARRLIPHQSSTGHTPHPDPTAGVDPFADAPNSSTLISPISPAVTNPSRPDTLDTMFADLLGDQTSSLSRGTTIIRHVDGGSVPRGREPGRPEPEFIGGGEVHIPPSYMERYPGAGAGAGR